MPDTDTHVATRLCFCHAQVHYVGVGHSGEVTGKFNGSKQCDIIAQCFDTLDSSRSLLCNPLTIECCSSARACQQLGDVWLCTCVALQTRKCSARLQAFPAQNEVPAAGGALFLPYRTGCGA